MKYLFILLLFVGHYASGQSLLYSSDVEVEEIRIAPEYAMGGSIGDYIDDIEFLKLEKPKEGWIGRVSQNFSVADRLILSSYDKMYVYDPSGRFVKTIMTEEKPSAIDNSSSPYNVDNKNIYIMDGGSDAHETGYRYDLDGNLIERFSAMKMKKGQDTVDIRSYVQLNESKLYFKTAYSAYHDGENTLLYLERQGETHPILKIDTVTRTLADADLMLSNSIFTSSFQDQLERAYYCHPITNEVFEIDEEGINKVYKFVLPLKNTVPSDLRFRKEYKDDNMIYFKNHPEEVFGFRGFIRYKDYLIFSFLGTGIHGTYAYSLKNKSLIRLDNLLPDESSSYLPLWPRSTVSWLFSDGEFLYNLIFPQDVGNSLSNFYRDKKAPEYLRELADYNNPILVKFSLK